MVYGYIYLDISIGGVLPINVLGCAAVAIHSFIHSFFVLSIVLDQSISSLIFMSRGGIDRVSRTFHIWPLFSISFA